MTNSQTASANQLEFLAQKTNITVDEAKNILSSLPVMIDPVEDILAIIGVLANCGLKGESFILNLYSSFLDKDRGLLVNPSKKALKIMNYCNLSFVDDNGDFIGIVASINMVGKISFRNIGDSEADPLWIETQKELSTFQVLFGAENVKEIKLLYRSRIDEVKQLSKQLKEISS